MRDDWHGDGEDLPAASHEIYVDDEPTGDVRLRQPLPRWPFVAGGAALCLLAAVGVGLVGAKHADSPAIARATATVPAPEARSAPSVDLGPDQAALGKLAGAMKDGAVVAQGPSPAPPGNPASPTDRAPDPMAPRQAVPHDASPYDAAPAPLPVEQSLLSPVPVEMAYLGEAGRHTHPRAAWDSLATGDAARRAAIDKAGALAEQGDMPAAREALAQRVAAGDALAAFATAETYDPARLAAWNAMAKPDVARAREFYGKAKAGGIAQAGNRIDALP